MSDVGCQVSDVTGVLEWAEGELVEKGVPNPRLDAELLLEHTLKTSRLELLLNPDRALCKQELVLYKELVRKRCTRAPLQYITGQAAFRYLTLKVTPHVLIPRPETECVAEEVVRISRSLACPKVLDIGTGSGAIALSAAWEIEEAQVVATDISEEALAVGRFNAEKYRLDGRVEFIRSDLFASLPSRFKGYFDVIASNPPYVPPFQLDRLQPEVSQSEPRLALSSSQDGLYFYRLIGKGAPAYLKSGGYVIMEIGARAGKKALELFGSLPGYRDVEILPDLSGHDRIIKARWHSS